MSKHRVVLDITLVLKGSILRDREAYFLSTSENQREIKFSLEPKNIEIPFT